MTAPSLRPPSDPPPPEAPADRWDGHACAYQDLMLELARIGTNLAVKLDALGGDLPILEQAEKFCEVARSVRLCALLAHKVSQPLPTKPLPTKPLAAEPAQKNPAVTPPERRDADRRDAEARETESRERVEDPMREHNLDRPLPELVKDIKRGLDAGALPGTSLRGVTEEAISRAIHLAARDEQPLLNRAARRAAARRAQAHKTQPHRPRAHPSG